MYNSIVPQQEQQQPTQSEEPAMAFAEEFKRFMNRLDEARKLLRTDLLD